MISTWMDLEGILLSQSDREREIPHDLTCMWYLKNKTNKNRLISIENKQVVARWEGEGRGANR